MNTQNNSYISILNTLIKGIGITVLVLLIINLISLLNYYFTNESVGSFKLKHGMIYANGEIVGLNASKLKHVSFITLILISSILHYYRRSE